MFSEGHDNHQEKEPALVPRKCLTRHFEVSISLEPNVSTGGLEEQEESWPFFEKEIGSLELLKCIGVKSHNHSQDNFSSWKCVRQGQSLQRA